MVIKWVFWLPIVRGYEPIMNDKKQVAKVDDKGKRELTAKNLKYIQLRLEDGLSPQQAYNKAGYTGKAYSAPYEMEHYLKDEMQKIVEANGINRHNLMIKAKKLIDLPMRDTEVTFNQHVKALSLAHKLIPENDAKRPVISPIIIKAGDGPTQINLGDQLEKDNNNTNNTTDNAKHSDNTH